MARSSRGGGGRPVRLSLLLRSPSRRHLSNQGFGIPDFRVFGVLVSDRLFGPGSRQSPVFIPQTSSARVFAAVLCGFLCRCGQRPHSPTSNRRDCGDRGRCDGWRSASPQHQALSRSRLLQQVPNRGLTPEIRSSLCPALLPPCSVFSTETSPANASAHDKRNGSR